MPTDDREQDGDAMRNHQKVVRRPHACNDLLVPHRDAFLNGLQIFATLIIKLCSKRVDPSDRIEGVAETTEYIDGDIHRVR